MPKTVVIDELHLTLRVPATLTEARAQAVRQRLTSAAFMSRLRRVIRGVVRAYPALAVVHVTVTR